MFASAATLARPLATATTATVVTETRAVRDSESRTDMHAHAGFFVANAVLSRDPLSQGPRGSGSKLPRPRGTRQGAHPQKHQKGTIADASPPTRDPDGSSWAPDACATRSKMLRKNSDTKSLRRADQL